MKKNTIFTLLLPLYLIFLTISIHAQDKNNDSVLIKACEDLILQKMESDNIVGVSAAIVIDDSVIWKNGFGYADKDNKVPMTVNTVVSIASITKTFTALALMQLQEKGLLNITQPLNRYMPQFNPKTKGENLDQLTIKSVITHSSGIQTDILNNSDLETGKYTDVLGYINETWLLYPPGLAEAYSGAGYNILGHLIKEVSKQDYPEYIKKNILAPLKMSHSGFVTDALNNRTKIYSGGKEVKEIDIRDIASGGIYTDIIDLARYAKGLLAAYNGTNTSLIQKETIHEMFTLQSESVLIESNKKALGWFMFKNDSVFALTHAGSAGFAHAELCLIPEKNAAVMILLNSAEGEPLRRNFCSYFLKKYGISIPDIIPPPVIKEVRKELKPVNLSDDILTKHAGDYAQQFSFLTIAVKDSKLTMVRDNKQYLLEALSENEFVPYEIVGKDSTVQKDNERYCFMDAGRYHILFHKAGNNESQLGYKLNQFDTSLLSKKLGVYDHYGYQLLVGDTKFKGVELLLAGNSVLILKLMTTDGDIPFPLNVISGKYAITGGLGARLGFTVKFTENDKYDIVDFGGITFRKIK
ncbi:MAG: beta-lactamase family protein [Bacteroidales bacterium]|nr:beta-lactamase family protein [Bacteroidales bacterium]